MKISCHEALKFMFWCIDNNGGLEGSDELKEMFEEFGFKEGCCVNYKCRHNFFWEEIKMKGNKSIVGRSETPAEEFGNCMCLLDRELTLDEIGEIYRMSRERVRQIEGVAMAKFAHLGGEKMVGFLAETLGNKEMKEIMLKTFRAIKKNKKLKKQGRPWPSHRKVKKECDGMGFRIWEEAL